jgi:very-short-patch-repair endonuclease
MFGVSGARMPETPNISSKRSLSTELSTGAKCAVTGKGLRRHAEDVNLSSAPGLAGVLADHDGVLSISMALKFMTEDQLRWQVKSGRWQKPARGVVVAQSGPLTDRQLFRAVLLRAGPQAVLAGLTAARLAGFKGFTDEASPDQTPVHLLAPAGYKRRASPPGLVVVTHYTRRLTNQDVHPYRQPRRTRVARSLVDAAAWMPTDRGAMAVLAAGVQQRLVRADDLLQVADSIETLRRRKLIRETIGDISGGSQALSELDFTRQVIRAFRLPEPSRQAARRDAKGRRRWTDVAWESYKIVVEIDGAQHTADPLQRWDDMERDIDLGLDGCQTLRFPAWLVRANPGYVAAKILKALRRAGYPG